MSIRAFTDDSTALLARIKRLIDQGQITTWKYDPEGDFTHTTSSGQWANKAWLRPEVHSDKLRLVILKPKGMPLTREVYAVYHGRFIEMLLNHFDSEFTEVTATALPSRGDRIRGSDSGG